MSRIASHWKAPCPRRSLAWLWIGLFLVSRPVTAADTVPLRGFHIGNSLTGNLMPHLLEDSFGRNGIPATVGWHIDHSQSAASIASNPKGVGGLEGWVPFYGVWSDALPGHPWDYVAIQTFFGPSGVAEVAGIQAFIDALGVHPANAGTRIYLYETWQWNEWSSSQGAYATLWERPYRTLRQPIEPNARFFSRLLHRLRLDNPSRTIGVIPVGEVFAVLDNRLRAQAVEGSSRTLRSAWDLYQDVIHLGRDGAYVAHVTTVSTLLNRSPDEMVLDPGLVGSVTPEFRALVHKVVWLVVSRSNRLFETTRE